MHTVFIQKFPAGNINTVFYTIRQANDMAIIEIIVETLH